MARKIVIPTKVLDIPDQKPFAFANFILWTLATHPQYNSDAQCIRAACRLEAAMKDGPSFIVLDEEDWKRLVGAVETPAGGYPIRPGSRMMPFVDAIVDATEYLSNLDEAKEAMKEAVGSTEG